MALPTSFIGETIADNTVNQNTGAPSTTSYQIPVTTITPGNLAAQTALYATWYAAIAAVTLGNTIQSQIVASRNQVNAGPSSNVLAQRENKWLLRYTSNTLHQKFQLSVGTADLSLLPSHQEFMDLSTGPGAALKAAFEAIARSPNDGAEAVTLDSVQFVGRNT